MKILVLGGTHFVDLALRGGEALAPGRSERLVQYLDVGDLLRACGNATGGDIHLTWLSDEFLEDQEVAPWSGLPMWIPGPLI